MGIFFFSLSFIALVAQELRARNHALPSGKSTIPTNFSLVASAACMPLMCASVLR